jgi:hypothetical protein
VFAYIFPSSRFDRAGLDASFIGLQQKDLVIKTAKEYSIHSASLDGDEFRIVGASPTINGITICVQAE